MRVPNLASLLELLEISQPPSSFVTERNLQFNALSFTSPPLPEAIEATPEAFRANETIDAARALDAAGLCFGDAAEENADECQITFVPADYDDTADDTVPRTVGVIFFGGALVDPRGYSPLMRLLSDTFGLPVSLPIFEGDLSLKFGTCETGRLAQAQTAFPLVRKWIFAGHSLGGISAFNDAWAMAERNETDAIGGLVLLSSYVRQDFGCGMTNFSGSEWDWLPFASVSASEDGVMNATNFAAGQYLLPSGSPMFLNETIEGGNHGGFGSYDDSERKVLLNQTNGNATITNEEQQQQTAVIINSISEMTETDSVQSEDDEALGVNSAHSSGSPSGYPSMFPTEVHENDNTFSAAFSVAGSMTGCKVCSLLFMAFGAVIIQQGLFSS
ncbi:hypothetical protein HJC23_005358 [Cyclotella cryptica]|uniref:Alpha/beta hydrolase fold-5 domain-containing protein n=1 Tax=Cyclotella cryptica TaxID=29204 RepID=A0ABD3PDT9_9STRA